MKITYVDQDDKVIGAGPIRAAYEQGIVVRISRIILRNSQDEVLIQKRAPNHALPNRWDQTAGGHVDENETYLQAAQREILEEMGIQKVNLIEQAKFYSEEKDESFTKKRFNALFTGVYDGPVEIDNREVSGYKWIKVDDLKEWMEKSPQDFTEGCIRTFKIYLNNT